MAIKPDNLSGRRYGRLVVSHLAEVRRYPPPPAKLRTRAYYWACRCDCGSEKIVSAGNLRKGDVRSCGCLFREQVRLFNRTHGYSGKIPEYRIWQHIKGRCLNPSDTAYRNYGGRGIRICDRWSESFEAFFADVGPRPSKKYSLDRINNNGNYEPGNVRWATPKTQGNNRRGNVRLTVDGETKTLTQWANQFDMDPGLVRERIVRLGWSPEKALTTPIFWRGQKDDRAKYITSTDQRGSLHGT